MMTALAMTTPKIKMQIKMVMHPQMMMQRVTEWKTQMQGRRSGRRKGRTVREKEATRYTARMRRGRKRKEWTMTLIAPAADTCTV